jgi:hypothetical protein
MKYTPYTEAQIQSMNVMDPGIYVFEVVDVILHAPNGYVLRDKNGNEMAKLKLMVWDNENRERIVYTFLTGDGNFAYKLRHFAKSIDMLQEYDDGFFDISKTIGTSGKAEIVIKKGTFKADGSGEMWADRNDVKDFISESKNPLVNNSEAAVNLKASTAPVDNQLDDDVPF